jgi:two-component system, sensor histidine kinase and response regulator
MHNPKILVVDDQPINIELIKRMLMKQGLEVLGARSGAEALALVESTPPDLILLDMLMPEMGGIEVCRRLQANVSTKHIPIIFVTAHNSAESRIEGLGVGAVDYISKPIDLDETLARVQTQLRLVAINREMRDIQHRLDEARRTATIGAVTQGIAHNLNNLLGVALGYLDLIQSHYDKPELVKKNAEQVEKAVQRIIDIIRQLGTVVSKSRPQFVHVPLKSILSASIARYQTEHTAALPVSIDNSIGELGIETQPEMLEDVLLKLLTNAWESYGEAPTTTPTVRLRTALLNKPTGQVLEITIEDEGLGIDESIRDSLFEPFIGTKKTVGSGMGLTVARHSMRNLGGELTLQPRCGGGTVVTLTHPLERKKKRTSTFTDTPAPKPVR